MPAKTRTANEARVEEILRAAQVVFTERGYSGATTDEIARAARASKTTLYAQFGNKQALFRTLLARRLAPADTAAFRLDADQPLETMIYRLMLGIVQGATSPDAVALGRIALAEAARFPELKEIMAQRMHYTELAAYLRGCRRKGQMAFKDAEATASMLVAMAQSDWTARALYGLLDGVSAAQLEAHAAMATGMFLAAVRPSA
jgi:AcrR family transcriptional regulator